jgi:hypothetical protein
VTVLETVNYGRPPLQSQGIRNEWVLKDNAPQEVTSNKNSKWCALEVTSTPLSTRGTT